MLQCGKGDISTYHDALMRCQLFPHGEGVRHAMSYALQGRKLGTLARGEAMGAGMECLALWGRGAQGGGNEGAGSERIQWGEQGKGEGWSGEGWRADGERGPIARQPPSNQSPSHGHLHKGIAYHGRGWTGTGERTGDEGRDQGQRGGMGRTGTAEDGDSGRTRAGQPTDSRLSAITEHSPHHTGLTPHLRLARTLRRREYPLSKDLCKKQSRQVELLTPSLLTHI